MVASARGGVSVGGNDDRPLFEEEDADLFKLGVCRFGAGDCVSLSI